MKISLISTSHRKNSQSNRVSKILEKTILEINNNLKNSLKESNFNLDFEKCVNNKSLEDRILEERIDGAKKYNIQSTPTLIINDKKFDKKLNYKNLKKTLEKMI